MIDHSRLRQLLREGYGVEDIALELDRPLAEIRQQVETLRANGVLPRIYGREM